MIRNRNKTERLNRTMKTIRLMLALLIVGLAQITQQMQGQTTLYSDGDFKLTLDGHMEVFAGTDNPYINDNSIHFGDLATMIRPMLKVDSKTWIAVFEPNISIIGIDNSNWLLQAAVGYKITSDLSVLVGRIMTPDIFRTPPARFNPLVRCPRFPYGVYGWGVQVKMEEEKWSFICDLTSDTNISFQDENSLDGLETSLGLSYAFDENWSLAGSYSYDFANFDSFAGIDFGYKEGPFTLRVVGYDNWNGPKDVVGAYTIATYLLTPHLEVHAGLDIQDGNGWSQTIGTRIFLTKDDKKADFRLDYIHKNRFDSQSKGSSPNAHDVVAAMRKRF